MTGNEAGDAKSELLDAAEVRVLAVLGEKEALTPDVYPLSLNGLTAGCNQLTSREPVMALDDEAVRNVLDRLIQRRYVAEVRQAGARVAKYEHRMRMKWTLEQDKLALLVLLMLRGPQTAGELRARSGRLHEFSSVGEVEAALQFLIDKYPPLVTRLARAPGMKEVRYAHLLSGDEMLEQDDDALSVPVPVSRTDRLAALEAEVAQLRAEVSRLSSELEAFRKQFD